MWIVWNIRRRKWRETWRKLRNEELNNLRLSPNIIRMKLSIMGRRRHVAQTMDRMCESSTAHNFCVNSDKVHTLLYLHFTCNLHSAFRRTILNTSTCWHCRMLVLNYTQFLHETKDCGAYASVTEFLSFRNSNNNERSFYIILMKRIRETCLCGYTTFKLSLFR
jgi:hypothetical protein